MIVIYIFGGTLILLIVFFCWYYFFTPVYELKTAKSEWKIFGLDGGFVPQGISYSKDYDMFIVSGYFEKNQPSRIYLIDAKSQNLLKEIKLKLPSGVFYSGHAGGVCSYGKDGFVVSNGRAYHFRLSDLFTNPCGEVNIDYTFETNNNADFCFVYEGLLFVGEFYRLGKFNTEITHHISLNEKEINHAVVLGYKLSDLSVIGSRPVPVKALSVPDMVQGIAINGGRIFVSCSYGLMPSKLFEYENVFNQKTQKYMIINEKQVPIYALSSKNLQRTYTYPEMLEEIEYVSGKLYLLFKSGSKKYRKFVRNAVNQVFSQKK